MSADFGSDLSRLSIFGALRKDALEHVAGLLQRRSYQAGEVIVVEGNDADGMYVVLTGLVDVRLASEDGARVIAHLGQGAVFGEMAIIDIMPRSATVVAVTSVETLFLSRERFFSLCGSCPETFSMVSLNLARELSRRLRCADTLLAQAGIVHDDDTARKTRRLLGIKDHP